MRSRAWEGTRQSIKTRVNLECEKEHQEHLLLSVMPAYIAAEVSGSEEINLRDFDFLLLHLKSKKTNKLRKVEYKLGLSWAKLISGRGWLASLLDWDVLRF